MWPASILINNRTDKLNSLIKYEINSIINKKGPTATGTPDGKNPLGSLYFVCSKAIKNEVIKKRKEINAGNSKNAVKVNVSGIIPVIFCQNIYKASP